jgi:hypothetical protein
VAILGFVGEIYFEDKVVAHYKDGKILKGHTKDFDPNENAFTLQPYLQGEAPITVEFEDLKAVFHVRTFEGNPNHGPATEDVGEIREPRFVQAMSRGRKTLLEFKDGERMWGFAEGVEHSHPGFFFFPTDPESNNLRVYVVRTALQGMVLLD